MVGACWLMSVCNQGQDSKLIDACICGYIYEVRGSRTW